MPTEQHWEHGPGKASPLPQSGHSIKVIALNTISEISFTENRCHSGFSPENGAPGAMPIYSEANLTGFSLKKAFTGFLTQN